MSAPQEQPVDPMLIARTAVPFVRSVRALFKTMVGMPTSVGKTRVRRDASAGYDVASVIGFSGDLVGTAVVGFQRDAAARLVSAFAGAELAVGHPDFADAVGELANLIVGGAKSGLAAHAGISCPTILFGPGHAPPLLDGVPCLVIPCTTPVGDFAIEINVKPSPAAAAAAAARERVHRP